ncbi:MAG: IclR family transcriptional regulator [Rhodospirillales bacterium]|nr:IclR family transcriptional regulator [Rhodospirillales bacterium]
MPKRFSVIQGHKAENVSLDPSEGLEERFERLTELGATGKAFSVLEAVSANAAPATMTEIIRITGMTKPTAHRIVNLLMDIGFLERDSTGSGFIEGVNLVELAHRTLAAAAPRSLRRSILQGLSDETGETSNYGVLSGGEVIYLDRVEAKWPLGLRFDAGSRVPAHCTAIGKLLLSRLPEEQSAKLLQTMPHARYTENTLTDAAALTKALAKIRKNEIGTDNQEFVHGVVCVAVPVVRQDGQCVGGIAISAPEARMTLNNALAFVPKMREAAIRLAATYSASPKG